MKNSTINRTCRSRLKNIRREKKLATISIATNDVYYKENGDKVEENQNGIVLRLGEKQLILLKKYVVKGKR
jgi:single-strand DNA-binding protein